MIESIPPITFERLTKRKLKSMPMVSFIYGMRSENSTDKVLEELNIPKDIFELIDVHLLPNSSHFMSMEKPVELSEILKSILLYVVSFLTNRIPYEEA